MHVVACKTVTVTKSLFATRFANWHFLMPNLAFFKGAWQWKLSFGTK